LSERQRKIENLQAVYRHHALGHAGAAREAGADDESKPETERFRSLKRWGPLGVVLAAVLGLGGKLKLLLPLAKFLKLPTLLTMVLSVWAYAQIWGVWFALGFVLLIFVHELGHAVVMRQQGIPAGAPVFIPFVGAVIAMRGLPRNAYVEALVGIGGPILGSAGALCCLVVGWISGSSYWYALAWTGFMLNLFNLIPISPLDGGRIVGVLSRWLWVAGYAIGGAVFLATRSPLLFLILLMGLFGLGSAIRGPRASYFDVAPGKRVAVGVAYFGLIGLLLLGMWSAGGRLGPPTVPGDGDPEGVPSVTAATRAGGTPRSPASG
jgi:Zn-dependent protease